MGVTLFYVAGGQGEFEGVLPEDLRRRTETQTKFGAELSQTKFGA